MQEPSGENEHPWGKSSAFENVIAVEEAVKSLAWACSLATVVSPLIDSVDDVPSIFAFRSLFIAKRTIYVVIRIMKSQ